MQLKIKDYLISQKKKQNPKQLKILKQIFKNHINSKTFFDTFGSNYYYSFKKLNFRKISRFQNIILIGMGGSALGAKAIYSFLQNKIKKNFYFIDNLKDQKINSIIKNKTLLRHSFFVLISKSGNTLETLVNYSIFKKYINKNNTTVITESADNELNKLAKKINLPIIEHKRYIGGRYSVLSEVGMLPAKLMNLNIKKFKIDLIKNLNRNFLIFGKSIIEISRLVKQPNNYKNLIMICYDERLLGFLEWLQQLVAESLGKENKGILPVISVCPKDHHSLAQLYLDGPKDKIFYIFDIKESLLQHKVAKIFSPKFKFLANKTYSKIIDAQKRAMMQSLVDKKIPFRTFELLKIDEKSIGNMFALFMCEVFMLGKLMGINPLNQPAVEAIKTNTKKFLTR